MANGATPTPQPQAAAGDQQKQMQDIMLRLMKQVSQPKTSVQPATPPQQPQQYKGQGFAGVMLASAFNAVQRQKKQQLDHAVGVLQSLNNAWEKAQELSQGDQEKAKKLFSQMPEVTHIFEDKKNVKQLGKLLQFDFMEPEKKKTVWHEALGKVAQAANHLPMVKAISQAMQKHKESQSQQQYDPAAKESQASGMAERFAGQARPDQGQQQEVAKMLPAMVAATGADIREREKELHAEHMQTMKQDFTKSIDSIKDPVSKSIARGIQLQQEGNLTEAQKYFDMAHKGAEAKSARGQQMTLPALIYRSINDPDPEARAAAKKAVDATWAEQEKQLSMRGLAFGMGRIAQYVNEETGETQPLNGFQVQDRIKNGESWQMVGNIPPDTVLAMQQVARTYQPGITAVESHLKAFDNGSDRAIIARIKAANPNLRGMDESTLGTWIDQNLTAQLSDDGKQLVQDIKVLAEVMGRLRKLTGQSSSEMNTSLLLGLLPDERTPNATYGRQQLEKVRNYIDGMVQAPILGGGRFAGSSKPATPAKSDEKPKVIPLD